MDYLSGWCQSKRLLEGCTVIVTGANAGIGKYTALDMYQRGARVIMACRNMEKAEKAKTEIENISFDAVKKGELVIEKLDLSSLESVRAFCFRILTSEVRIDVLINNAGAMLSPRSVTEDGFEAHIGTNHFGHALLTLLLLPKLIKNAPARVVTIASMANIVGILDLDDINIEKSYYFGFKAYSRSKSANILFSRALHLKLQEHGINGVTTYSLHPGIIGTEIMRHFDTAFFKGASWIFSNIINLFIKSPLCGAQTSIYCAVDDACANESGLYYRWHRGTTLRVFNFQSSKVEPKEPFFSFVFSDCGKSILLSSQCKNDDIARKFWDLTIEILNLREYDPFLGVDPDMKFLQSENNCFNI